MSNEDSVPKQSHDCELGNARSITRRGLPQRRELAVGTSWWRESAAEPLGLSGLTLRARKSRDYPPAKTGMRGSTTGRSKSPDALRRPLAGLTQPPMTTTT